MNNELRREKVIAALEICDNAYLTTQYCRKMGCPYVSGNRSGECIGQLHEDIKATLGGAGPARLSLDEIAETGGNPVYVRHCTNHNFSGWAVYHSEQMPYFKFDTFKGTRIMLNTGTYGSQWECWTARPLEQ